MPHTATIVKGLIPFRISFVHPCKNPESQDLNQRRVKKSTGLTDYREAEKVKAEIDAILATPSRWYDVGEASEIAKELWRLPKRETTETEKRLVFKGNASKLAEWHSKAVDALKLRIRYLEGKNTELEALLRKYVGETVSEFKTYIIEAAIEDFVSSDIAVRGTKELSERVRNRYRLWLKRFVRNGHQGKDCNLITADEVVSYLSIVHSGRFKGGKTPLPRSTRKEAENLLAFLRFATKDRFKAFNVTEWMKRTLIESDEHTADLWLDETEWNELAGAIENPTVSALASLQYWCGFRPEELCYLRRSMITTQGGETRIEVGKLLDDAGNVLWKPKTRDSYGKVYVPSKALKALRTLTNANKGSFLLFPPQDGKLWNPDDFTKMYLSELRKAATKLEWDAERFEMLDSRTPRRSCGKRVLLATDLKTAAAVLRDTEATVRKHYARLLADDVKNEH